MRDGYNDTNHEDVDVVSCDGELQAHKFEEDNSGSCPMKGHVADLWGKRQK